MTTTAEPPTRRTTSDPVAEIDALIVRNPGWYEELTEEKRRLLGETVRKILES